jgi:hypothetical protein
LLTRIEGIEATSAAPFIELFQWVWVLDAVRSSYGSITLGDDETVTQFVHHTRNHQRAAGGTNLRMIFSEAYEGSVYTAE